MGRVADRLIEVAATVLLSIATLLAAWNGHQAATWNGVESGDFVKASGYRVDATSTDTSAGQDWLHDGQLLGRWLDAHSAGNDGPAAIYERRFRGAFRAALPTDPFNNPSAVPGPLFMKEYVQAKARDAARLEALAAIMLSRREQANKTSNRYVFITVASALALFLAGIADRFTWRRIGIAVLGIALFAVIFGAISLSRHAIG
jgi:hypothetical protein